MVQLGVVRHENILRQDSLDERMAAVHDMDDAVLPQRGTDISVSVGGLGQRNEHVGDGQFPRGALNAFQLGDDLFAHRVEKRIFNGNAFFLRA